MNMSSDKPGSFGKEKYCPNPECGRVVHFSYNVYCYSCGYKLEVRDEPRCGCGETLYSGQRYCSKCGKKQ
jgi:predicted amidophosphoribosyltransferase